MQLSEMNWPAVDKLSKDTPVIVPIAAMEQHGWHMPLYTDSLLLGEVVRRSDAVLGNRALFTPLTWLGNSDHHLDFPGTLSAAPRDYLDTLNRLFDTLIGYGFRRITLINGHGGNIVPGQQAVFEVRQRYRERADLCLLMASYWGLGSQPKEHDPKLHQSRVGHACEYETSMMLRLAPQLVGDIKDLEEVPFTESFDPGYRGWITKDRTVKGHIGHPRVATPEKGELLFSLYSRDVVAYAERMIKWDGKSWNG